MAGMRSPGLERYYMIDPWAHLENWDKPFNVRQEAFESVYNEAMRRTEFAAAKRTVLRGRTQDVANDLPSDLDMVYIDGDHTLRGITIDLIKLFPKVRSGGLIGGDDFVQTPWQHPGFEPTLVRPFAVYFAEAMNVPIVELPDNQFAIQKIPGGYSFTNLAGQQTNLTIQPPRAIEAIKRRVMIRIRTLKRDGGL